MDIPPQFDRPPSIPVIEQRLNHDTLQIICRASNTARWFETYYGCAVRKPDKCVVFLSVQAGEDVRRHELAHCNGWQH